MSFATLSTISKGQAFGEPDDCRHGRTNLAAHVRQELGLELVSRLEALDSGFEFGRALGHLEVDLRAAALHFVCQGVNHVGLGNDAHELPAFVHDRQAADRMLAHLEIRHA